MFIVRQFAVAMMKGVRGVIWVDGVVEGGLRCLKVESSGELEASKACGSGDGPAIGSRGMLILGFPLHCLELEVESLLAVPHNELSIHLHQLPLYRRVHTHQCH